VDLATPPLEVDDLAEYPHAAPEGPYRIFRRNEGAGVPGNDDWVFFWEVGAVAYRAHDRWPGMIEARLADGSSRLYASDHPDRKVYLQRLAELATCDSVWRRRAGRRLRADDVWSDEWPEVLRGEGFASPGTADAASDSPVKPATPRAAGASRRSKAARSRKS
jgi:hypothetical protein